VVVGVALVAIAEAELLGVVLEVVHVPRDRRRVLLPVRPRLRYRLQLFGDGFRPRRADGDVAVAVTFDGRSGSGVRRGRRGVRRAPGAARRAPWSGSGRVRPRS